MKDFTKKENEQREQSKFLVKIVPYLYKFDCFVFHGGTIINLYDSDKIKRYSVDLDGVLVTDKKNLTIEEAGQIILSKLKELREELMLPENKEALGIRKIYRNLKPPSLNIIIEHPFKKGAILSVKLEVNKIYIGSIGNIRIRQLGKAFRDEFKTDNYIRTVSDTQLYGGKFKALLARNTIKDSYDVFMLLKEGMNFNSYKKGIIYNLLSSKNSVIDILNADTNEPPKELETQLITLGTTNFSLKEHIETRKKAKAILIEMLNQQDLYYILASAMGVIDQTDYEFKNMLAVKHINRLNKDYLVKTPETHKRLIDDFIKKFPLTSIKTKTLYNNYKRYIERQINSQSRMPFKIDNSIGQSR